MAAPMPPEELDRHVRVLDESGDRDAIAGSACALAASGDPPAILTLARRLRQPGFLSRLDETSDPSTDILHLSEVFGALRSHPTPATGRLCELIYYEPDFRAIPARVNLLLGALAAVVPVSPDAARVFQESSAEGFAEVNGPLLVANESPLALQVFEELIGGSQVAAYVKVDILHRAVLPRRTRLPVVETCARLLAASIDREVTDGIVETLFDHRSREWFGPALQPPAPPPWESGSTEVLRYLAAVADDILRSGIGERLRTVIVAERARIEAVLTARLR